MLKQNFKAKFFIKKTKKFSKCESKQRLSPKNNQLNYFFSRSSRKNFTFFNAEISSEKKIFVVAGRLRRVAGDNNLDQNSTLITNPISDFIFIFINEDFRVFCVL